MSGKFVFLSQFYNIFGIVTTPKDFPVIFHVEPWDKRLEQTAWKLYSVDKNPRLRTTLHKLAASDRNGGDRNRSDAILVFIINLVPKFGPSRNRKWKFFDRSCLETTGR